MRELLSHEKDEEEEEEEAPVLILPKVEAREVKGVKKLEVSFSFHP